jgi:aryl-alcohol dehydrogenase-like predicted oxidoreductase
MRRVMLGKTGLMVSRLGLGTDVRHDDGAVSVEQETEVMLRAWGLGINFIDTDRWYKTYPSLAAALPHMERSRLVLATKTYEKTFEGALGDVQHTLDTLKTAYIDLFLLHAVDSIEEYSARAAALEALHEAQTRGWIRHIGLSTHAVGVMRVMAGHPEIEAILVALNLAGKSMRHTGSRQEMEQAVKGSYEAGQGVYVMKPFARGRLFEDENKDRPLTPEQARLGLAYLCGLPYIHSVIPGMRTVQQVEQNVAIVEELEQDHCRPLSCGTTDDG